MKTHSIRYRVQLLKSKQRGYFPGTSWPDLLRVMHKPTTSWPTEKMVCPQRHENGLTRFDTPMGIFWAPPSDHKVLADTQVEILSGVYAHRGATIDAGAIVFDLGANLGTFTRWALDQGAARVISFEPQSLYRECLARTFAAEIAAGQVSLIAEPVWSDKRTIHFTDKGLVGHVAELDQTARSGEPMTSVTLDEVAATLQLSRVDYLKADIEGAERHALRGARQIIQSSRPRIAFCIYHYPDDPTVIADLLRSYQDYRMVFDSSRRYIYCW